MKLLTRMTVTLALMAVLLPYFGRTGQAQSATIASKPTCTISGRTGVAGTMLQGLPGNVVTDQNGVYSAQVPQGWSGRVVPTKEGYVFEPPTREYRQIEQDYQSQDYTARLLTITISGSTGVPGVRMNGLAEAERMLTDANGGYRAIVPYGWSGVVRPEKAGYVFEPAERRYSRVTADLRDDYVARIKTFTIAGSTGLSNVWMVGLPRDPRTDNDGQYNVSVPHGWTGVVRPKKEGYTFIPPAREYSDITADHMREDFDAQALMLTISDTVVLGDAPVAGVAVRAEPGGASDVTNAEGRYSLQVPYGWSGQVTLHKEGFQFVPDSLSYTDVTSHIIDKKRVPADEPPVLPLPRAPSVYRRASPPQADEVLIIPTSEVLPQKFAETAEDIRVMLNILQERLSEPRAILGALYDYGDFFGPDRRMEAVYLQGHGIIFVLRVDFPLAPTPGPQGQAEPAQKEAVDPVWQQAQQRLYGPANPTRYGRFRALGDEPREVNFEQFRDDLLKTLKHAANIRHIDPNERIILTVLGRTPDGLPSGFYGGGMMSGRGGYGGAMMMGGAGGGVMMGGTGGAGGYYGAVGGSVSRGRVAGPSYIGPDRRTGRSSGRSTSRSGPSPYDEMLGVAPSDSAGRSVMRPVEPMPAPTALTIQAKKADIDAFARGDLNFEEFRRITLMFTY